jgi:hypothetical protein
MGSTKQQKPSYLEGAGQDVPVVRQSCCKRRAIVEDVLRLAFTAPELLIEGIQLVPQRENLLLLSWEAAVQNSNSVILLL